MQTGFADVPKAPAFRLTNARAPLCLLDAPALAADRDGLAQIDLTIADGRITSVLAAGTDGLDHSLPALDLRGGLIFPRFVEAHTHLDKGHIWPRRRNPDGTFMGALTNVTADREANWNAADVKARMTFGLESAYAHGTAAIRTHLDSVGTQIAISWPVFDEVRAEWADRVALQATPLFGIDHAVNPDHIKSVVAAVKRHGSNILGAVTYMGPNLKPGLEVLFRAAMDNGFDLDFHVDETNDPAALSLEVIAETAIAVGFQGRILCGHCCSLALQMPQAEARVIAKVAEARIAIVCLPMCNMYLQDRMAGRTPRWRGVTLLHEMKQAGIPVMVWRSRHARGLPRGHPHPAARPWRQRLARGHHHHTGCCHAARPWRETCDVRPGGSCADPCTLPDGASVTAPVRPHCLDLRQGHRHDLAGLCGP
ncbi:MAG: cytosine deaminase [Hyphomicrobiales bacterium]|nr:cytosine deaminase [Hyphomicrobiales bacterium]